ncbi:MAG: matrixin family metalloprotease [Deltaproteobacteria bacterium]|nr:matrixin family metalloprotease [Deltaproteobacteria bacterium]
MKATACLLALAVVALALAAEPAHAWRQYHTSTGKPMHWPALALAAGVTYSVDDSGLGAQGGPSAALAAAIAAGFGAWGAVACPPCGVRPWQPPPHDVGWRPAAAVGMACQATDLLGCKHWEPNGNQVSFAHTAAQWPFGAQVVAMTVVSAAASTGEIVDADIALHTATFGFCLGSCAPGQFDVAAVVQHEAGHFAGLDHSLDPAAVMFTQGTAGIGAQPALSPDDRAGLCGAYAQRVAAATCGAAASDAGANDAAGDGKGLGDLKLGDMGQGKAGQGKAGGQFAAGSEGCRASPGGGGPWGAWGLGLAGLLVVLVAGRRSRGFGPRPRRPAQYGFLLKNRNLAQPPPVHPWYPPYDSLSEKVAPVTKAVLTHDEPPPPPPALSLHTAPPPPLTKPCPPPPPPSSVPFVALPL